jgi:hypothetical protein
MTKEATEIEVEVVEIDGIAPVAPTPQTAESQQGDRQDWRHWQGRIRSLDSRWWPLWLFLGGIAVVLALTAGLAIAVIYLILRVLGKIIRAVLG